MQEKFKKINQKIEREKEITFFGEGKLYKEWKREQRIYSEMMWIRRDKIRKDGEKDKEWY